jgi:CO dehydrogenase/acetyl-CoA synthase epsilon subunit
MNCKTSRVLRLINYLPIIGSVKNVIDLIIISCKGESDEILEAAILTVVGLLLDYFTFGTTKGAFQGMFKCGNAFKICSEEFAKKITYETSGEAIEKMAGEMFKQAIDGILIICKETGAEQTIEKCSKFIVTNAKEVAVNATKIAAQKLALCASAKVVVTKALISRGLMCLANGTEDMIEFARRLLSHFAII